MTKCECGSPPCKCKSFQRDAKCEHRLRGEFGKELHECGKVGTLRDDCHTFFQSKKVLCEEHYGQHYRYAHTKCGICGTTYTECCC